LLGKEGDKEKKKEKKGTREREKNYKCRENEGDRLEKKEIEI